MRLNLRERGWVEKFAPRMLCAAAAASHTTDAALQGTTDEGNTYTSLANVNSKWGTHTAPQTP